MSSIYPENSGKLREVFLRNFHPNPMKPSTLKMFTVILSICCR